MNLSCRVRETYQAELVTMWEKGIVALTPSKLFCKICCLNCLPKVFMGFSFQKVFPENFFQKQLSSNCLKSNLSLLESERNYTFFSNGQVLQINNYSRSLDEGVYHCKVFDRKTGSMISKQIKIGILFYTIKMNVNPVDNRIHITARVIGQRNSNLNI